MSHVFGAFPLALLVLTAIGCRNSDQPELGEVKGTVYFDGQPVDGAIVYFSPEGGGRVSQAMTDSNGVYELVYKGQTMGAKTGEHQVRITTAYEMMNPKTGEPILRKELIPKRYNDETTELRARVEGGENTIDFKLASK